MRLGLWLCLAVLAVSAAPKKPITIDAILAAPDSGRVLPVWSPDGRSFVYEKDGEVYLYRSGMSKPKLWFDRKDLKTGPSQEHSGAKPFDWRNRRASNESLQWFPNGQDLLVLEDRSLFVVHPGGLSELVPLPAPPEDPQLSPDGKLLLYRTQSDLYVLNLAGKQVHRLTNNGSETLLNGELDWVYPEELDLGTAVWWSPDSTRIAYLQFDTSREFVYPQADLLGQRAVSEPERYPQAGTPNARVRLGVVPAQGGETIWMKAGGDENLLMARVSWLPDSSKVALETMPRIQNALDLLLCDPASGDTKSILHEESKTWINVADNLFFLNQRPEFLWTSERTGFRHIYRYSNTGELLAQLTSGNWEVKTIDAVNEATGLVYYSSGEETPLETHLATVPLPGGTRVRVTEAGYSHHLGVGPKGYLFVDQYSNLKTPPETVLRDAAGRSLLRLHERDRTLTEGFETPKSEIVSFKTSDGVLLYGRLTRPVGFDRSRKYPLIVTVYGGPGAQSVRNEWERPDMAQVYAAGGYVVWALDNRGAVGRGHAFEEPLYRNLGSVEVSDQLAGVDYLIKQGFVDRNRVGVTGWSYGGYMTVRCLLKAGEVFKVGVAGAPVTDWHNYDTIYTERYMGLPEQNAAAYSASSNLTIAASLQGKLLIQHNLEDDNVLFQNTMQLVNALEEANKEYVLQLYPNKSHGVGGSLRLPLYREMLEFFQHNL